MDVLKDEDLGAKGTDGKNSNHSKYWPLVKKYLSNAGSSELDNNYSIVRAGNDKEAWFIIYMNANMDLSTKQKLKARAESVGLLQDASVTSGFYGKKSDGKTDNDFSSDKGNWVFMRVK